MSDTSFLKLYKSGAVGLVLTGASQIWLGVQSGDAALFGTGAATLAGALFPFVAQKRLQAQVDSGQLEKLEPKDAVSKAVNEVLVQKKAADDALAHVKDVLAPLNSVLEPVLRDFLR